MEESHPLHRSQPASKAIDRDDVIIPIIDFSGFPTGSPSDKQAIASSIVNAFQTSGFLYLKNHGILPTVVSQIFDSSARFFARPRSEKDTVRWTTPQANRGYVSTGKEKLTLPDNADGTKAVREAVPDLKETMEIGREGVEGFPNQWPDQIDDEGKAFKQVMMSFFETCKTLYIQIMRAIALGMNLPEHFFDEFVDAGDCNLRLLHYPPVSKDVFQKNPDQVRAGEHSDYGSITLLFQDSRGGLQVRSPRDTFVDVVPIPGTIVVNAGDLLARWANDKIKSTRHRVVEPPKGVDDGIPDDPDIYPARYSIAYFCNPNMNAFIDALPGTYGEDINVPKKHSGIVTEDYLVQRLSATI
ncbi:Oxidoreductase, 2OG-FeII oxygenase family [Aspergillus sclerotialis]|uniref:Oxidoreductase, 2OG-FeII oxygenase family n=1 Tax=Aspergillus sclerotialis TaxID=2070753 RepID=A0A3A2ZQ09_9EURO|nr:Oxidoreductase, 2OG-FeII oxygenase family [Aspergillus sclerotialis]